MNKLNRISNAVLLRWPHAEVSGQAMVGVDSMEIIVKKVTGGSHKVHSKLNG